MLKRSSFPITPFGRLALVLGATAMFWVALGAAPPAKADGLGVAHVGSLQLDVNVSTSNSCQLLDRAIDSKRGLLLVVYFTFPGCGGAVQPGKYLNYLVEAYSTRTLRKVGAAFIDDYVDAHIAAVDEGAGRLYLTRSSSSEGVNNRLLGYSITALLGGAKTLSPVVDVQYPNAYSAQVAAQAHPVTAPAGTNPTGPPADIALKPGGIQLDVPSRAIYAVEEENLGNTFSWTSTHGPSSQDMYLLRFDVARGTFDWLLQLNVCSYSTADFSAMGISGMGDAVFAAHGPYGTRVVAGCTASRSPAIGGNTGGSSQDQLISYAAGGTMATYVIPVDRAGIPDTSAMSYDLGRPNVLGALGDPSSGRMFWPGAPAVAYTGPFASGPAAVAFDAAHESYVGAPTVAGSSNVSFALAAGGGRLYSAGPDGIRVIDATATQRMQGLLYPGYACQAASMNVDQSMRRLFILSAPDCASGARRHNAFDVYEDDVSSLPKVPATDPDTYTQQVTEKAGVTEAQIDGSAGATGTRLRLVGGTTGFMKGATFDVYDNIATDLQQQGVQPDNGTRELQLGIAEGASLDSYQSSGQARIAAADATTETQVAGNDKWPFKEVACSDPGTATDGQKLTNNTFASVACDLKTETTKTSSQGTPVDFTLTLVSQGGTAQTLETLGTVIGRSDASATINLDPKRGMVSEATSVLHGLSVGTLKIDLVESTVTCQAHGRTGTASCVYTREILGATQNAKPLGTGSCHETVSDGRRSNSCQSLLDTLNKAYPGYVVFTLPEPDAGYGMVNGSHGGFQSLAQRNLYEHLEDSTINYDDSQQVPALRIFYVNDGADSPSRVDLQLASVEAESHYGISQLPPPCTGCDGVLGTTAQGPTAPTGPVAGPTNRTPVSSGGLGQIIGRIFAGLQFLLRSPAAALGASTLILMLASPLLMGLRRRQLDLLSAGSQAS